MVPYPSTIAVSVATTGVAGATWCYGASGTSWCGFGSEQVSWSRTWQTAAEESHHHDAPIRNAARLGAELGVGLTWGLPAGSRHAPTASSATGSGASETTSSTTPRRSTP